VGLAAGWRRGRPLFAAAAVGAALFAAACAFRVVWWGGSCYGPRMLADVTPLLAFGLVVPVEAAAANVRLRTLLWALAVPSIALHAVGAGWWDRSWDDRAEVDLHPDRLWSWSEGPIAHYGGRAARSVRRAHATVRLAAWGLPTSVTADGLAAAYPDVAVAPSARAGGRLEVHLRAFNTGRATWLDRTATGRGSVRVGWSWSCDGRELPAPAGRIELPYPLFPGEAHTFREWIAVPEVPGACVVRLGLVSELVAWFDDVGTPPVRRAVAVSVGG
jgi:hypothetical protein